jgi:hypothetical protein
MSRRAAHQELLLTDILHQFARNPIRPAYRDPAPVSSSSRSSHLRAGLVEIGHREAGFAFDTEGSRHRVLTEPFRLADSFDDQRAVDGVR